MAEQRGGILIKIEARVNEIEFNTIVEFVYLFLFLFFFCCLRIYIDDNFEAFNGILEFVGGRGKKLLPLYNIF